MKLSTFAFLIALAPSVSIGQVIMDLTSDGLDAIFQQDWDLGTAGLQSASATSNDYSLDPIPPGDLNIAPGGGNPLSVFPDAVRLTFDSPATGNLLDFVAFTGFSNSDFTEVSFGGTTSGVPNVVSQTFAVGTPISFDSSGLDSVEFAQLASPEATLDQIDYIIPEPGSGVLAFALMALIAAQRRAFSR